MGDGLAQLWDGVRSFEQQEVFGCAVLLLALVFLWSGIPKLQKPMSAAFAIVDLGAASTVRRSAGLGLGIGELVLATLLAASIVMPGAGLRIFATLAAAVLLWTFVFLLARALRSGEEVSCFCFGDEENVISGITLMRTIALALIASGAMIGSWQVLAVEGSQPWLLELTVAASILGIARLAAMVPAVREVPHECP